MDMKEATASSSCILIVICIFKMATFYEAQLLRATELSH
ncbi:unnamed protein product [Tenebrio molitor]|nr:unnamed protein product [Tenebrio molitor]